MTNPQYDYKNVFKESNLLKDAPILRPGQTAIEKLESISAVEKAMAVPFIKIWQIHPATGEAMRKYPDGTPKAPLNLLLTRPPDFGDPARNRLLERPPVSLESIKIKTENPRGVILYRTLEFSITVHRPEVLFEDIDNKETDVWASMVTPGCIHAMEYGWSSNPHVENGLLNGAGYEEQKLMIPGKQFITFVVTSYSFSIGADGQYKFNIKAFEQGELRLRHAFIGDNPEFDKETKAYIEKNGRLPPQVENSLYDSDRKQLKKLLNDLGQISRVIDNGNYVKFGDLLAFIYKSYVEKAFVGMGMTVKPPFLGSFNDRAGKPASKFGLQDLSGKSIGEFRIPTNVVRNQIQELMDIGERMTIYNVIGRFINIVNDPTTWIRKEDEKPSEKTYPDLNIKTSFSSEDNKVAVKFAILDVTNEYVRLSDDDHDRLYDHKMSKDEVRQKLKIKNVPYIALGHAKSFVKNVEFGVVQDEMMQSIFINRALGDNAAGMEKKDIVKGTQADRKQEAPLAQQIYSPVIQGSITMIGNFVFDTMALIWIDFGVDRWNGPFNIQEKEDTISNAGFESTIRVYSAGTDPFGTQGRNNAGVPLKLSDHKATANVIKNIK